MDQLQHALALLNQGQPQQAAQLCRQHLASHGAHAGALHILALALQQNGDPDQAGRSFAAAAELAPNDPLLLFNYGFFCLQQGDLGRAEPLLRRVARLKPELPEVHFQLGNLLAASNRLPAAVAAYRQALALRPDFADAANNLGAAYKSLEDFPKAIAAFRQSVAAAPDNPGTWYNLGMVLQIESRHQEAVAAYQRALVLAPDSPQVLYNLGIALCACGAFARAVTILEKARRQKPDDIEVLNQLGVALHELDQNDRATEILTQALSRAPDSQQLLTNLGNAHLAAGQLREAEAAYQRAVTLQPDSAKSHYNLAKCLFEQLRLAEAIDHYRKALALKPGLVEAHWNLSHALLLTGRLAEGFQEYRWRWQRKKAPRVDLPVPTWQGEKLPEATLLIHTEQGLGDSIQFVRYLEWARPRVGRLILACEQGLLPLFASLPWLDRLVAKTTVPEIVVDISHHLPLLDLPAVAETGPDTIPAAVPYLAPDPTLVREYGKFFTPFGDRFRVGLVWQGNPGHGNDQNRSCSLELLAPLLSIDQACFFSLQKEKTGKDKPFPGLHDLAPHLADFAATAAMIAHLDLVISVDTAVAHLAGALARPVWTLLPRVPDWRWLVSHEQDSPWYPTMRLFRQPAAGDWSPVVKKLVEALQEEINRQPGRQPARSAPVPDQASASTAPVGP